MPRVVLPFFLFASLLMSAESDDSVRILRDFSRPAEASDWPSQNDGVMGGVSTGGAEMREGVLRFSGNLSLENNGGFAQIHSATEIADFSDHSAVRLRVKGDGRTYQFRIATEDRYRGSRIAYRADFPTEDGKWTEVTLPFDSFVPGYRGRTLSGPPLDLTKVRRIAFLLADGNPGKFALEVDWIGLE